MKNGDLCNLVNETEVCPKYSLLKRGLIVTMNNMKNDLKNELEFDFKSRREETSELEIPEITIRVLK